MQYTMTPADDAKNIAITHAMRTEKLIAESADARINVTSQLISKAIMAV